MSDRAIDDRPFVRRVLPDGRILEAWGYLFNTRVTLTEPHMDGICWVDAWCYATRSAAEQAVATWDGEGEPTGWIKHPNSGRYRPHGDPAREEVNG